MSINLHICSLDKFIPPFLNFVREQFPIDKNQFYILGDTNKYSYEPDSNTFQHAGIRRYWLLLRLMNSADKIILHGLFSSKILIILALNPYLLKKCYWVIWGGDLYSFMFPKRKLSYKLKEKIRGFVIERIGFLLTYVKGDVDLARNYYGARGQYIETIGYLSNVIPSQTVCLEHKKNNEINILLGNSADPTNNHFEALDKLAKFKDENIQIYAPLSYGDKKYARKVIEYGNAIFGDKFISITEFIKYDEYMVLLRKIDIAIFNHERQQAMGNTINLLAMGKKVYLREGTTQKAFFDELCVKTFSLDDLSLSMEFSGGENIPILESYFSKENFRIQWKEILED